VTGLHGKKCRENDPKKTERFFRGTLTYPENVVALDALRSKKIKSEALIEK